MKIQLRPDQRDAVDRTRAAFAEGARSVVLQAPTGFGKTYTTAEILRSSVALGFRAVFMAHLDTLVEDTFERVASVGLPCGYIQAGRPSNPTAPVQVCSIGTIDSRDARPPADLFVLDECHRAMGPTTRRIIEAYPSAHLLGLTATPQRGDAQPLGDVFQKLVIGPSVRWLTDQGLLVPCDVVAPPYFEERGLAMDPVDAYAKWTPNTRAIVFASTEPHAEDLAARFTAAGFPAATLLGDTPRPRRRELRRQLASGELKVLVGIGVFIEGFDCPPVETIVLARAFGVTGSFLQAIGRGLRTSPSTGKTRCTVLDLRGAVNLHGLPDEDRRWSLDGKACVRTETLKTLRRCETCLAIFRPAKVCPRCGSEAVKAPKVPRVLNRAEKMEKLSGLSPHERDARYMRQLRQVAVVRLRLYGSAVEQWAMRKFVERFGREPQQRGAA